MLLPPINVTSFTLVINLTVLSYDHILIMLKKELLMAIIFPHLAAAPIIAFTRMAKTDLVAVQDTPPDGSLGERKNVPLFYDVIMNTQMEYYLCLFSKLSVVICISIAFIHYFSSRWQEGTVRSKVLFSMSSYILILSFFH